MQNDGLILLDSPRKVIEGKNHVGQNPKDFFTRLEPTKQGPNGPIRLAVSDYAQDQLGEIVFVEAPEVGDEFEKGEEFGTVESTQAVSELNMTVGGKIVSVNEDPEDSPELVRNETYGKGWIVEVAPSGISEMDALMDKNTYL